MGDFTADQIAAIRELQSRRSALDPTQASALDELATRAGIGASAPPQTIAEIARQRLASRGLTPEAVKAGGGIAPLPGDTGTGTPVMRSIAQGLGIPTSVDELKNTGVQGALNVATAGTYQGAQALMGGISDAQAGRVPVVSPLAGPTKAAIQNRPQTPDENADAIRTAAPLVVQLAALSPTARAAAGSVTSGVGSMPETAANLINRYLGDGAIDTTLGKNAGRGISRAKVVAATAEGVQKGVQQSITDGQAVLKRLLDTPQAQAPTIDGTRLIRDAFGEPPMNITGATLGRWEEFAGNIAQKVHDVSEGTMRLSPAQVDALKGEIDVQFGKLSADATELNLNQKAAGVRRAFDHAVDQNVRGYAELNDHLSDLHHADSILTEKIAQNATTKPLGLSTVADPVRSFVGTPMSSKGTRPGILTTPGRTGLAALLSKAPSLDTLSPPPSGPPLMASWLDDVLRRYGSPTP